MIQNVDYHSIKLSNILGLQNTSRNLVQRVKLLSQVIAEGIHYPSRPAEKEED
jgi:hypothetical protein